MYSLNQLKLMHSLLKYLLISTKLPYLSITSAFNFPFFTFDSIRPSFKRIILDVISAISCSCVTIIRVMPSLLISFPVFSWASAPPRTIRGRPPLWSGPPRPPRRTATSCRSRSPTAAPTSTVFREPSPTSPLKVTRTERFHLNLLPIQ